MAPRVSKRSGGAGGKKKKKKTPKETDVFRVDDSENVNVLKKYDVDVLDFDEFGSDFEDEEIDEDEAFNAEDYDLYGDVQMGSKKSKKRDVPSSDDDDDDNLDSEDGEFLSNLLDKKEERPQQKKQKRGRAADDSESDDGMDEQKHGNLLEAIGVKKGAKTKSRSAQFQLSEHLTESEYNLPASKGVSVDGLLGMLGEDNVGQSDLKKRMDMLKKSKVLDTPTHRVDKELMERQIGYDKSKKDISKWQPIVKKNREADHLDFPRNTGGKQNLTTAELTSKFEPSTDLEKEIANVLEESGMSEAKLKEAEELELKKLTVEEEKARREKLSKQRALMYYDEMKARRQKKIKSRSFHKILKKETERKKALVRELQEADPELAEELRRKDELNRAKERMNLKHKNKSKWVQRALQMRGADEGTREAVNEQLRLGEELRKKMDTMDSSEEEGFDAEGEEEQVKQSELWAEGEKEEAPKKGLFSLKFMQRAKEKRVEEQKAVLQQLRQEQGNEDGVGQATTTDILSSSRKEHEKKGRKRVGDSAGNASASDDDDDLRSDSDSDGDRPPNTDSERESDDEAAKTRSKKKSKSAKPATTPKEANPGSRRARTTAPISVQGTAQNGSSKLFDVMAFDDAGAKQPTSNAIKKGTKRKAEKARPGEDNSDGGNEPQEIDEENPWLIEDKRGLQRSKKVTEASKRPQEDVVLDVNDTLKPKDGHVNDILGSAENAEHQKLIAAAFASGDQDEEFEKEKQALFEADLPKTDVGPALPGWGSWAGDGVKQRQTKAAPAPKVDAQEASKRKDKNLRNVIINEKKDKKLTKYTVGNLPFPYTSIEQYERAQRNPLGKEWNTSATFKKLVQPKVTTHAGNIIQPIQLSRSQKEKLGKKKKKL